MKKYTGYWFQNAPRSASNYQFIIDYNELTTNINGNPMVVGADSVIMYLPLYDITNNCYFDINRKHAFRDHELTDGITQEILNRRAIHCLFTFENFRY